MTDITITLTDTGHLQWADLGAIAATATDAVEAALGNGAVYVAGVSITNNDVIGDTDGE